MGDIDKQFEELMRLTNTATIVDLSKALGVATSTARGWKTRGEIPKKVLLKAKNISQKIDSTPSGYISLDFFDIEVSAGHGTLVECEDRTGSLIFSENFLTSEVGVNPKNIFLMPVKGDSMTPTLKNQSIVMVNRINKLIDDGVYVFRYDGMLRVKRLQFSKNGIAVVSDNTAYKTWELSKAELATEDFEIIGEVVWSGQRM